MKEQIQDSENTGRQKNDGQTENLMVFSIHVELFVRNAFKENKHPVTHFLS